MKTIFRNLMFCVIVMFTLALPAQAEEAEAKDLTNAKLFTERVGFPDLGWLYDGMLGWGNAVAAPARLTMASEEGIGSLYIRFQNTCGEYTLTDPATGISHVHKHEFIHDFIDLEALFGYIPSSVSVSFEKGPIIIRELTAYSAGKVPAHVQQWKAPKDNETDLVLFSTHGDDEHLFFAGILPHYAKELGYQVQVVYLTDHHNYYGLVRPREILDGLWAVGVDTYPVFGTFPDFRIDSKEGTYRKFLEYGYSEEDFVAFVVENIRRFKPKVVIGHDFAGEYGHGQHQVYADALSKAIELSMDETQFPESANTYGIWDVPKSYFHLYEKNPIVMDWDQPLESFDGMTAYEVSIWQGFQKHVSQIPDFAWYYEDANNAAEVKDYNPRYYGLFRSTVGEDINKNDFFENVTTYAQDAIAEIQRKAEEEAARLAAELEAQRKVEEEAAARKAAQLALKEAAAQEAAKAEKTRKSLMSALWIVSIGLVIAVIPLTKIDQKVS